MGYDFHHILKYMPSDVNFLSPISKSIEKFLWFRMMVKYNGKEAMFELVIHINIYRDHWKH